MQRYDVIVIVIGAGPGGYNAASRAGQPGLALTCRPHPTRSEALRQAALDVRGRAMQH